MLDYFLITWITTSHISHLIMHGQNPTVDYAWFPFSSRQLIINRWYRKLHLYHLTINIRHPTSCYENNACNFSALGSYFRHLLMFFVINAKFLSEKYPIQIYTKVQRFFIVIYLISPLFSKYVYLNKKQPFLFVPFLQYKIFFTWRRKWKFKTEILDIYYSQAKCLYTSAYENPNIIEKEKWWKGDSGAKFYNLVGFFLFTKLSSFIILLK